MRRVRIGQAVTEGVRVVVREPLAFLAWTLVYGVLGVAPQLATVALSFRALAQVTAGSTDAAALVEAMRPAQAFQPLSLATSLVAFVVLYGATFRAVLEPEDRRFLFLRLGAGELWMALTSLALVVLYFAAILIMMIPFFIILGVSAAASGAPSAVGVLILFPLVFVMMGVVIWGACRLAIAVPAAFAERAFPLPGTWRSTAGHAGSICVVFVTLTVSVMLLEMLLLGAGVSVVSLFTPLADVFRQMSNPAELFAKIPLGAWVAVAIVWALFGAALTTAFGAAMAKIYHDLVGDSPADFFA